VLLEDVLVRTAAMVGVMAVAATTEEDNHDNANIHVSTEADRKESH